MINPLKFLNRETIAPREPVNAVFLHAAGVVRPLQPALPAAKANLTQLDAGLAIELEVVAASITRLPPPPAATPTLRDRVRAARQRLASGGLVVRQTQLLSARRAATKLRADLELP